MSLGLLALIFEYVLIQVSRETPSEVGTLGSVEADLVDLEVKGALLHVEGYDAKAVDCLGV